MRTFTALDLITRALRSLNIKGAGETPNGHEQADGLEALNDLVDGWNAEGLLLPATARVTKVLAASQGTYTIGEDGEIDVARPNLNDIEAAGLVENGLESDLGPLLDVADYARIGDKVEQGTPTGVYYRPSYPLGEVILNREPDRSGLTLALYIRQQLEQFEALSTEYTLPQGYAEALRYNLAVALSVDGYGAALPASVAELARTTKGRIKSANLTVPVLTCDPALVGRGGMGRARFENGSF